MESLQVGGRVASRSGSPGVAERDPAATDDAVIRSRVQSPAAPPAALSHHDGSSSASSRHGSHHVKSHSRDLARDAAAASATREPEESPQRRSATEHTPGYSPNVSYALSSADEYGSPAYRGQMDGDYSQYQGDDADGSGGGPSARAAAAIAHLNSKVTRTRELMRLEQTIRDDNVNEYLKLAASADKQQLQRIKAVFEKKNQKSAHCIAQLQKKLETYHKRIRNWEEHGSSTGHAGAHRPPREVLRDMGQGLKNMGGNIRDGITGLGGSVMAAPREFAHMFTRANRFGSADNISQLAAPPHAELRGNASSEGSRASEGAEGEGRGSTLPRAAAASSPPRRDPGKASPDDASPCSSVTSESGQYQHQAGSNMSEAAYSIKPILNELRERREDYERLSEKFDTLKKVGAEVSFLSAALQEERFRTERLEEQINDLTELHQNEVENLKQALADVEEKVQYQSEERIRDIHEALDLCQTKISKLEHLCQQGGIGGGAGGGGGGGGDATHNLPPRVILVKLLNVALTLLQLVLLLVATVAGIAMPFLRTRVRVLTTSLAVLAAVLVLQQWPDVAQAWERLLLRLRRHLDPELREPPR